MNKLDEENYLSRCLTLIEAKLNRGTREDWSNYDFERLIDEIHTATGVRLSLTTLKRVSGRVKYDSFPTHTTLNALTRYVGFSDWRDFVHQQELSGQHTEFEQHDLPHRETVTVDEIAHGSTEGAISPEQTTVKHWPMAGRRRLMWFAMVIPLLLAVYLLIASRKKRHLDSNLFSFRADKVYSVGVPNSVVFHYDASRVPSDSVFIVQTWDISRKTLVDRENHEHSAIYYYPGFFRTKLIVDGEIVKTHNLQIATDGWLSVAEKDGKPVYFSSNETVAGDSVTVGRNILEKYNLPLHPNPPFIRMFNQRELGSIMNDNFTFETELKNPFQEGSNTCQFIQVLIQCKDDVIIIPIAAKACIGDLMLYACGYGVDSKHGDLSGFGCDPTEWVKLRVETREKHMKFFVNGKRAYELDFPNEPVGIVGVQFRFNGPATVRGTRFESPDSTYILQPSFAVAPLNQ